MAPSTSLLDVHALRVTFLPTGRGGAARHVVEDVSLTIGVGETVCLVGESGSGKTLTGLALLGLAPTGAAIAGTSRVVFEGRDLLRLPESEKRALRGRAMAMIFQEPSAALNPVLTVGDQIAEVVEVHARASKKEAWARAVSMLRDVGIADPAARAKQYPHELSGGMRQRVMIAMALVMSPALLIADEPTTALDVTVQAQLLDLLRARRDAAGMSLLFITHDLGVVAEMADRVLVMYAGRIVEEAPVATLFAAPAHPYTEALLAAVPTLGRERERLAAIAGRVADAGAESTGCAFRPRCPRATSRCATDAPELVPLAPSHAVRCHHPSGPAGE